jgi:hypothetical protein
MNLNSSFEIFSGFNCFASICCWVAIFFYKKEAKPSCVFLFYNKFTVFYFYLRTTNLYFDIWNSDVAILNASFSLTNLSEFLKYMCILKFWNTSKRDAISSFHGM